MNRILIIGATGRGAARSLSRLPAAGLRVRALARNPHTAGLPPHVDAVRGDLTLFETLDECLDGIDAVFLTSSLIERGNSAQIVARALLRAAFTLV
jgi:uncharacterized protein YbjT (DUF2867 family)